MGCHTSFIATLLSKTHPVYQRVPCLTNSTGQDILHNLIKGKQKTVKLVQLSIVTKRKTESNFMINSLDRFGHSISYDEVNKTDGRRTSKVTDLLFQVILNLQHL